MDADSEVTTPRWQRAPAELAAMFGEMVRPLPGVELRKMFGYPSAFFQGQMFAGLHQSNMILRLSAADRARFLALEGAAQFEPMAGRPMREYVVVPPAMIGQVSELAEWLDRALSYVATLPPKEPKKKRKPAK